MRMHIEFRTHRHGQRPDAGGWRRIEGPFIPGFMWGWAATLNQNDLGSEHGQAVSVLVHGLPSEMTDQELLAWLAPVYFTDENGVEWFAGDPAAPRPAALWLLIYRGRVESFWVPDSRSTWARAEEDMIRTSAGVREIDARYIFAPGEGTPQSVVRGAENETEAETGSPAPLKRWAEWVLQRWVGFALANTAGK